LRPIEQALEQTLRPELFVVGRTWAALTDGGLFIRYDGLHRLPERRDGGVVKLTAMLVDDDRHARWTRLSTCSTRTTRPACFRKAWR
jgi:hypothetical protein